MYFTAQVVDHRSLGSAGFVLRLAGCEALAQAAPGQFVMVRGEWGRDPLLPRAFSILRTVGADECELLIKPVGRGTRLLEGAATGSSLAVLGPLGRRFPAPVPGRRELLVAGGVGLAPLLWHAQLARVVGTETEVFYGARTAQDLVLLEDLAGTGCRLHLATEDGSRGAQGRVTTALAARLASEELDEGSIVLTCGPNAMMRAVVELTRARGLSCFVSVEGEMACGVGACLGCAVPLAGGPRPFAYACVDGPVFDSATVVIP